jgi:hypothetical protein
MYNKKFRVVISKTTWTFLILICLCCFTIFVTGCSRAKVRGLVPAEGVLIYEGQPLAWTIIAFAPEDAAGGARLGTAQTDGKGRFVLKTLGDYGVLPGDYRIAVTKYIPNEGENSVADWKAKRQEEGFEEPKPQENVFNVVLAIPEKFTTTKNSELKFTVESGGNSDIKIELQ